MFAAYTIKEGDLGSAIQGNHSKLGKEGMRNVSWLDVALYLIILAMNIRNDGSVVHLPPLLSARLNFLLASAALMRLLESKSSLFTDGSASLALRDTPA